MEDFISILILILLGLAPTIIKLVKGEKPTTPKSIPILEDEEDEEAFFESPEMQKSEPNLRNQSEYFTYETLTDLDEPMTESTVKATEEQVQLFDNKEEEVPKLTLEPDEIFKGVIYAEILKRKY